MAPARGLPLRGLPERGVPERGVPERRAAAPAETPRAAPGGLWLWGRHAVEAALANPERKILRLVATEEVAAALAAAGHATDTTPERQILTREAIDRLLPAGAVHQGLALLTRALKSIPVEDLILRLEPGDAIVVALDQVTDPHNVGAILRSAAAFGAVALILPDRHAPEISGALAKAASGAVEHVPVIRAGNLVHALDRLKAAGFWSVGLAGDAPATLASLKPAGRTCLVLGSEGEGLRRLTREACDFMARLPAQGKIASLNVSTAAAIALYELVRGRSV